MEYCQASPVKKQIESLKVASVRRSILSSDQSQACHLNSEVTASLASEPPVRTLPGFYLSIASALNTFLQSALRNSQAQA